MKRNEIGVTGMGKRGLKPGQTPKKGEPGYWERNTEAARAASSESRSIFETPEDFTEAAEQYFAECDAAGVLYSISGLCLGLMKYGKKHRFVSMQRLQSWQNGTRHPDLKEAAQCALLRIQCQIETDPRYMEKGGATTKGIFLLKQPMLGGYIERVENKTEAKVQVVFGKGMEKSDFE